MLKILSAIFGIEKPGQRLHPGRPINHGGVFAI